MNEKYLFILVNIKWKTAQPFDCFDIRLINRRFLVSSLYFWFSPFFTSFDFSLLFNILFGTSFSLSYTNFIEFLILLFSLNFITSIGSILLFPFLIWLVLTLLYFNTIKLYFIFGRSFLELFFGAEFLWLFDVNIE